MDAKITARNKRDKPQLLTNLKRFIFKLQLSLLSVDHQN